jgi:hypothetical protein
MFVTNVASSFLVLCRLAVAFPHPSVPQANSDILIIRASEEVNPNAVTDTTWSPVPGGFTLNHSGRWGLGLTPM